MRRRQTRPCSPSSVARAAAPRSSRSPKFAVRAECSYTFPLGAMRPQLFTLEEANALLPRLRDLLFQIQESKTKHDRLEEQAEEYAQHVSSNGHVVEKKLNETRQELA